MSGFSSIDFAPAFSWPVLFVLAAAATLLLAYAAWRRAPGTAWRALAMAAILLAQANPSLVEEQRQPLRDVVVVVADDSPSQTIGDRTAQTQETLADLEDRLAVYRNLEVRVVRAGGPSDGPTDDGTRLFEALDRAVSDVPPSRLAGAILVTDGQVHDVPANPRSWDFKGPVHTLLTGRRGEADRRLLVSRAPRYGIVGETLSLTLRIEDEKNAAGTGIGARAKVSVRQDGETPVQYDVPIGGEQEIPFKLSHGGQTVIELAVEPGPNELTLRNNRAVVVVNGIRDRLRVLLVSGLPHAGERTWRNLLKADPSVDLVHFTILRPPEKQDGTPINELSLIAFPIRELFETKLNEFDLIIFDRYRRRGVLPQAYLRNIADYVLAGGAVLEAAGPDFASPLSLYRTPLQEVLPGRPSGRIFERGFRPVLTAEGRRHPVTAGLPGARGAGADGQSPAWGRWFRLIDVEPTRGSTLMSGTAGKPVLLLDRIGEGRVAQLLSDQAWLWARGFEGGGPQAELLRRLAHWLMKEPDLEEDVLRGVARGSRLDIERRSLSPDAAPVTVTSPSGQSQSVTLEDAGAGRAIAAVAVTEPGLYRLTDGTREAVAAVGNTNPREFSDVRATASRLAPVAATKGGAVRWIAEDGLPALRRIRPGGDTKGRGWIGLVANRDYLVTGMRQVNLLPPALVLAAVIALLLLAWRREGR